MDKETFLSKIQEIGTCEDEVQRRTILAEVQDEVSKVYDTNNDLVETNKKYVEDNEDLRRANLDLFKRIGKDESDNKYIEDETGVKPEEEKPKRKFEDLFNNEGVGK